MLLRIYYIYILCYHVITYYIYIYKLLPSAKIHVTKLRNEDQLIVSEKLEVVAVCEGGVREPYLVNILPNQGEYAVPAMCESLVCPFLAQVHGRREFLFG